MKVLIKKKLFFEGLERAKESVGKQITIPILKNIRLTAKDGSLKLYTTNLAIGTVVLLRDLSILSEGETTCDALKLIAIVRELPDKEVRIFTEENGHLVIECEKSYFRLFTIPPEEFPSEPQLPEDKLSIIEDGFFDSLRKLKYAISKDDKRYTLNGIYFGTDVVATDGHRMATVKKDYPFEGIIVPSDFINLILKLKNRKDTTFRIGCGDNKLFIKSETLILYGGLLEGKFPDYSQVIPPYSKRQVSMDRSKLSQAIKRMMLMSRENSQIKFEFGPYSLILSSFTPDLGEASEEIEAEYKLGREEDKRFTIALNGRFLLDALETLEEERVSLLMNNDVSPVKIEENDSIHILMPLRLPKSEPEPETEFVEEEEAE